MVELIGGGSVINRGLSGLVSKKCHFFSKDFYNTRQNYDKKICLVVFIVLLNLGKVIKKLKKSGGKKQFTVKLNPSHTAIGIARPCVCFKIR